MFLRDDIWPNSPVATEYTIPVLCQVLANPCFGLWFSHFCSRYTLLASHTQSTSQKARKRER